MRIGSYIIRFIGLILIQGLLLEQLPLGAWVNPYIYILFLILLPVDNSIFTTMVIGFFLGSTLDLFNNTFGMHASACVFLAFIRPKLLRIIAPREGYEIGSIPGLQEMGLSRFSTYAIMAVIAHHFWFFMLETWYVRDIDLLVMKLFVSSIASVAVMILAQYITYKPKRRNIR